MPEKGTSLCLISKSILGWHLKSSIKVVYFVPTKSSNHWIELYHISLFQSVSESLCVHHRLRPLLKPSPPLLPVQFTQSSLRTAAMPIVCSFYVVKLYTYFLPFIPRTSACRVPEPYQSYPTSPPTMPAAHSAIPYSPDMHFPAHHSFQRITAVTIPSPLLPPVHCCKGNLTDLRRIST
jgi:hypothetical protein